MPRNASGTYSLPSGNPVVAGTTIEAAWANNTLSDVGNELTNSLSRQGTGGMLAALRLADGSVTVPGLAFVSETTTGFYRAASNDMRMAILGSDVWAATSSAFTISKAVTLSVASNLGTPSALTLTNATGLPLTTGVTGTLPVANGGTGITAFGTGVATALGQNVTGSGGIVLATSPTLTTPNLGTPSAVTLTNATGLPIATGVSGLGTGVATALAVNTGSSGAFVVNGGALGTPSSGTVTNLTGTASININGTVGATTPTTGAFTTLSASGAVTLSGGTANGVLYLNGSKVATSGSALTFDGTDLATTGAVRLNNAQYYYGKNAAGTAVRLLGVNAGNVNYVGSIDSGPTEVNYGAATTITTQYWNISGSEAMRLNSTGLGIGAAPTAKLDVVGGNGDGLQYRTGTRTVGVGQVASEAAVYWGSGTALTFFSGLELMRLNSTGLGIGTSSPGYKLDVVGSTPTARVYSNSAGGPTATVLIDAYDNSGYSDLNFSRAQLSVSQKIRAHHSGSTPGQDLAFWTGGAETMRLDGSGNLGLGVTPSAWSGLAASMQVQRMSLVTSSPTANDSYVNSNAYYNGGWKYIGAGTAVQFALNATGDFRFYTAPSGTAGNAITFTQAMTLDASGNLGVGTTSPSSFGKLAVTGSLGTTYINDQGVALVMTRTGDNYFNAANGNFNYGAGSHVWTNSAQTVEYARITSAGNVVAGGSVALATTATDGFLYVPTCAGTPTGTPTAITGMAPIVVNTTNNKLYFYSGGAWRDAGP